LNYKKGLISFCETGEYSLYTDYFLLNKQIERIKEIEEKKVFLSKHHPYIMVLTKSWEQSENILD